MSYTIYTTEAFIFKERNFGESGKIFSFFTKDFGRIDATAQGVRYLKSKLRYSLSGLSILKISFVGTANGYWRLTGAEEILPLDDTRANFEKMKFSFVLFSLIDRMVQGQQADEALWNKLVKFFLFVENNGFKESEIKNLEIFVAIDLLKHLGYMEEWGGGALSLKEVGSRREYFLSLVHKSIEQSQL